MKPKRDRGARPRGGLALPAPPARTPIPRRRFPSKRRQGGPLGPRRQVDRRLQQHRTRAARARSSSSSSRAARRGAGGRPDVAQGLEEADRAVRRRRQLPEDQFEDDAADPEHQLRAGEGRRT